MEPNRKPKLSLAIAVLASIGQTEAITEAEKIAFSGVDTLQVLISQSTKGDEPLVSRKQLRTKAEFILRTAGVPVHVDDSLSQGPWLEITVVAFERKFTNGKNAGHWAVTVHAGLFEAIELWRGYEKRSIPAATWIAELTLFTGPTKQAREALLNHITEVAEEVSNLYLATR